MVESSMSRSNLQLCLRRGSSTARPSIATVVPTRTEAPFEAHGAVSRFHLYGVLHRGLLAWCIGATSVASMDARASMIDAGIHIGTEMRTEMRTETRVAAQSTPAVTTPATVATPTTDAAVAAFLAARAWLDADALPAVESPSALVALDATTAVCVILRLDGRIVGVGEDATSDGTMVRRALGRAVTKALGDETIRAVRKSVDDRVTARLSLELELAGPLTPLLGRTVADAAQRVAPSRDGIAVLRAESVTRAFPSRLNAADNADRPDRTIATLLVEAGLPAKDLPQYTAHDRVSLARFTSVRIRQDDARATPTIIERGGRTVELVEITPALTRALATQLCARLAGQVVARVSNANAATPATSATAATSHVALLGTLNPTAAMYDPPFAGERDGALAAFALARAATSTSIPLPTRTHARARANALLHSLLMESMDARPIAVDAYCALTLCTLEPAATPTSNAMRAALSTRINAALARTNEQSDSNAKDKDTDNDTNSVAPIDATTAEEREQKVDSKLDDKLNNAVRTHEPELIALLAAAALALDSTESRAAAMIAIDALLTRHESSRAQLVDATLAIALIAQSPTLPPALRARCVEQLARTVEVIDRVQIRAGESAFSAGIPADLDGGLLLPSAHGRLPDTQSLRVAAGVAGAQTSLEGEPKRVAATCTNHFMRFLAQHIADDPWVGGLRDPASIRGLVRGSLASDDCPPSALIAGLLLALEAMHGAEKPVGKP